MICKVLARRLESVLLDIIDMDQNGFVKGIQGFHNVRRVLNILHERKYAPDTALLSVDAEKAFDRIEWPFLFAILDRFGIGTAFCNWVRLLYTQPTAEILTNNVISQPFNINRGVRQGALCHPSYIHSP